MSVSAGGLLTTLFASGDISDPEIGYGGLFIV
jgi:hypothetical protein